MTETVLSHLNDHAEKRPEAPAFGAKVGSEWVTTSWEDYRSLVRQAGRALIVLGLEPGGTVGILGFNRPEWAIGCLGSMAAGGVPAGIYQNCAPNQVGYILGHASSLVVIVEDGDQWQKVDQVRDELPDLEYVVLMAGAVPRVWERIHAAIQDKLQAASGLRRRLADWALEVGREVVLARDAANS